jgi:anti-anti-sigma regulatory factor
LLCKGRSLVLKNGQMLKIQRVSNNHVVFTLSGRMDAENVAELKEVIESEARGRGIALDLRDLTLVDRDAVKFLERCESDSIKLENCPAYIREWIAREREGR